MKVTINLNSGKDKMLNDGRYPLFFYVRIAEGRFKIKTGHYVFKEGWDPVEKVVRNIGRQSGSSGINDNLKVKRIILENLETDFLKRGIPINTKNIKEHFKKRLNGTVIKKTKSSSTEFAAVAEFLKNKKTGKPGMAFPQNEFFRTVDHYLAKSKNSDETKRKLKQVLGHLLAYKPDFNFQDLTEDFYNEYFMDHLVNIPICDNTIDKHIAEIKKIANYATGRFGFDIPSDHHDYSRVYQNPFRMFLNWDEVKRMEEFEPLDSRDQEALDLFIISCYTGLRWQNVSQLKAHNFVMDRGITYLQVITFKNRKPLRFALPDKVLGIIDKYKRNMPKHYNSDVNERIQNVARAVGLKDTVYFTKQYKGEPLTLPYEKWQKVTMHVARHSFACEFLRRNKAEGIEALKALCDLLNQSSIKITEIYWNMINAKRDEMLRNTFT